MALRHFSGFAARQGRPIHNHRGAGAAMIHALLCVCLLLQQQNAEPSAPSDVSTLLQSGVDAENRHDLDKAVAAFRKATDLDPSSGVAFLSLGDAYMRKRDYAAAIPPLKRAAELNPDSLAAHQL